MTKTKTEFYIQLVLQCCTPIRLHKCGHTKCHRSISVHLTTKPKPVSCLAFQIFHICKVYFNLPAVVSNFPLGKMPCSPAIVSQNWKTKSGIDRKMFWEVLFLLMAQDSLCIVSVVQNLHSFRRVTEQFLSTVSAYLQLCLSKVLD